MLGRLHKGLDKWLTALINTGRYPNEHRLALLELRSGQTWLELLGDHRCAFTDDGARLISFTEGGRYEYDVPPRWQYFTPWAWVALGAC